VELFEVDQATPFDLQLEHFVDVIQGNAEVGCSGVEGLRALVVCDAVQRALESGETVDVGMNLFREE
jgi:predicted dehydrogenase